MNNETTNKQIQETAILARIEENALLRRENEQFKLREEQYLNTIKEQGEELERLRAMSKVVENHFSENGPGWQVERCVGCGKCDYTLLEESLTKVNAFSK